MTKILIAIGMLFLLIGIAAAFDVDSLKVPDGYNNLKDGCAAYTTNGDRMIYVEKVLGDYKTDWFTNTSDMTVSDVGNNTYYYEDTALGIYGYQEIVVFDGENYMVSVNQNSKLSPSEKTAYLKDIQEFNKLNNLEPIAV